MSDEPEHREKARAIWRVATYNPTLTAGVIVLSFAAAILEGIGIGFVLPIVELATGDGVSTGSKDGFLRVFVGIYEWLGIPFTMETVVAGVVGVMGIRFSASFVVSWLRALLRTTYVRHLQTRALSTALDARVAYYDEHGSDDILNAIVTQATHAGNVISQLVKIAEQGLLAAMYFLIALALAPMLTIGTGVALSLLVVVTRFGFESGYTVGDRVAEANEEIQQAAQAGTQGIRDVKLFNMQGELFSNFVDAMEQFTASQIKLRRNQAALNNAYQFFIAVTVFVLVYLALTFTSLSLGSLSVFLFAVFRLGPRVSNLNTLIYRAEGSLPHLTRTEEFVAELERNEEPAGGNTAPPGRVESVEFSDVSFAYDTSETVLDEVSFSFDRGDFVAFVGPSGAGKSTVVSLLTKMYDPDDGEINVNGTSLTEIDTDGWREQIAVIQQDPYVFNDTLRYNITVGNREATPEEIRRVSEIAEVTEFLDDLPDGYDTVVGDDGVRLSGGQRQRIAIARALLKDAELLVFDEATSDLDSTLEERVQEGIEAMDRNHSMIAIAHRLSTITNADQIYTMRDGRITEIGTHQELIENHGKYAELYATQSHGP